MEIEVGVVNGYNNLIQIATDDMQLGFNAFEELLEEQKGQEILKWGELEEGQIYEIVNYEFIDTRNGKSCVTTLSDDNRVWSPLALTNILEKLDMSKVIAYDRPTGKKESKKTGHTYNSFDLVVTDDDDDDDE